MKEHPHGRGRRGQVQYTPPKERDLAPSPDAGDLASSRSSIGPPMAFPQRPAAGAMRFGQRRRPPLCSPPYPHAFIHTAVQRLQRLHRRHVQFTPCKMRCSPSMAQEFRKRIVPHSMRVLWSCSSEMLVMLFGACALAVGERRIFPLVSVPWPCRSEMLTMWFEACVSAVERAPSPSLPLWPVDHGCVARRHSPCGLGLMRVHDGEGHLFRCSPSTMPCSLETLACG